MSSITPPQWPNITPPLSGPAGNLARGGGDWPSWQHLWPDSQPDFLEQQGNNQDGGLGEGVSAHSPRVRVAQNPSAAGGAPPEMITAEGETAPPHQSATRRPKPPAWRAVAPYSPGDRGVKRTSSRMSDFRTAAGNSRHSIQSCHRLSGTRCGLETLEKPARRPASVEKYRRRGQPGEIMYGASISSRGHVPFPWTRGSCGCTLWRKRNALQTPAPFRS